MNEVRMKSGAALLTALVAAMGACQFSLDYDDYAFEEGAATATDDDPLLGSGGQDSQSQPTNGGGPSASGGGGTGGATSAAGSGGALLGTMGGSDTSSAGATGGDTSTAGNAGATGAGGTSGAAGEAGLGGQGGTPNPAQVVLCRGCVELVVPVDGGGRTPFQFLLTGPADFTSAVVQWRILSLSPNAAFFIKAAVQGGAANDFAGLFHQPGIPLDRTGWTNVELDVAASNTTTAPPGTELYTAGGTATYDKTQIVIIGIEVGAFDSFTGAGEVRLLVDDVIISDVPGVASKTFAVDEEGLFADVSEGLPGSVVIHHAEFVQ